MMSDTSVCALTYCTSERSVRRRNCAADGPPMRLANCAMRGASSSMYTAATRMTMMITSTPSALSEYDTALPESPAAHDLMACNPESALACTSTWMPLRSKNACRFCTCRWA